MKFENFMFFNFFELQVYLEYLQVGVLEATARDEGNRWGVFWGRQSTRGHHTNVLWQFGGVLFLMIFDFF